MERGVVLRVGELFLKGRNRPMFEQALSDRINKLISRFGDLRLARGQGRVFITGGEPTGLLDELSQVFGLASLSPVVYVEKNIDSLSKVACELAREAQREGARKFRITARRADKRFELTSGQINVHVGELVVNATGLAVDLEAPDLEIGIEIGPIQSFVFSSVIKGCGGLPVGVAGNGVLLLSGGIDSPVAGHLMQKRGLRLIGVHFHAAPWTSAASQEKARQLATRLARRQGTMELHTVAFGQAQELIRDRVDEAYRIILYRRLMLRIAQRIAEKRRAKALITGDALGQVASQTVENLDCIGDATRMLVLRPLLGFDKSEVIDLARSIGTYETSIQPHDDCCSLFVPRHPQTKGSRRHARKLERRVDVDQLVDDAFERRSVEVVEA